MRTGLLRSFVSLFAGFRGARRASAACTVALAVLLVGTAQPSTSQLPADWATMEIESKWDITAEQYAAMIAAFRNGGSRWGYTFAVRWGGIPRRFVDTYYDTLDNQLASGLHTLRHRARYQSDIRPPQGDVADGIEESALDAAPWRLEWESMQYKSTPCRIGATWFREETGACRLRDEGRADLCAPDRELDPADLLSGSVPGHDAMAALRRDHPQLRLSSLRPAIHVSDYRYRVVFSRDGRELFELSLDRLYTTDLVTGRRALAAYEAELEIVAPAPTEQDVRALLSISDNVQREFGLRPSTRSKGLVEAPVGSCDAAGELG